MASQAGGSDTRKNIKAKPETYRRMNESRGDRTWDEFLRALLDGAPVNPEYTDIPDGRVDEIARRTADEIEERMR